MKTVEVITKTTRYWLFKKINPNDPDAKYFYVRCQTDNVQKIGWFMGYKDHMGLVSSIGGALPDERCASLEREFQEQQYFLV